MKQFVSSLPCSFGGTNSDSTGLNPSPTGLTPSPNRPHPQPLSKGRGEWYALCITLCYSQTGLD
ncbi:MAG: hypothetical protein D8H98_09935 [Prevotella sp.]|nr:MAG: hypothetical protein D8H98_09935 [Prevotella sp.]